MTKYAIRKYCIYSLIVVTPLGFLFKIYPGPGRWWFNDYGAGLFYGLAMVEMAGKNVRMCYYCYISVEQFCA